LIEVKNLVKDYYGNVAVNDLSFTIESGEVVGFLGPNGAGKSTTMNIITGYISASEGQAIVNGYDVFEEPEKAKKSIGYLPEQPPLYPDMMVKEYLMFVANLKKVKKSERASMIADIMELTKITDMSGRLIKYLSKGYKQRVGLAAAIVGYPEILILDEPTVGLDPTQIIEIRELIKSLSKKHTILLSSHIMQEVDAVCDKIIIINKGQLVAYDTPANIAKVMEASRELFVTAKGDAEKIVNSVNYINGVKSVRSTVDNEYVKLRIKMEENCDVREAVSIELMKLGSPITEMRLHEVTLEEIFLNLTDSSREVQ